MHSYKRSKINFRSRVTILFLILTLLNVSLARWTTKMGADTMDGVGLAEETEYEAEVWQRKCQDALPTCDAIANPAVCCMAKPIANSSCQKACKFCHDINTVPGIGGLPGGIGLPGTPEPPTVQTDPCNPGSAPGVSPGGTGSGSGGNNSPGIGSAPGLG